MDQQAVDQHVAPARRALFEVSDDVARRLRDPRLVLAIVAAITGAIALLVGYWGVSGTLDPGRQLPYLISGGVGGLFLLGAAAALYLGADLGANRRELTELRADVARLSDQIAALHDQLGDKKRTR